MSVNGGSSTRGRHGGVQGPDCGWIAVEHLHFPILANLVTSRAECEWHSKIHIFLYELSKIYRTIQSFYWCLWATCGIKPGYKYTKAIYSLLTKHTFSLECKIKYNKIKIKNFIIIQNKLLKSKVGVFIYFSPNHIFYSKNKTKLKNTL